MTSLAHATLVEHQIMEHIKDALRLALDARAWPAAQDRKLASVRFMAEAFERHFQRLLDLEEDGGYLSQVQDRKPQLLPNVSALRHEHTEFRQEISQALQGLRSLAGDEVERFEELCRTLRNLLDRIDAHDAKEIKLMEKVLLAEPVPPKP